MPNDPYDLAQRPGSSEAALDTAARDEVPSEAGATAGPERVEPAIGEISEIWAEGNRFFGCLDEVTRLHVAGWVADRENLDRSLAVSIFVNGEGRGKVVADGHRSGFAAETGIPQATGNYSFRFDFEEPLSAYQRNEVVVRITGEHDRILGTAIVDPIEPNDSNSIHRPQAPILVSSMGRTGSTFLMAILAAHPQIVVAGKRPFEIEMICYYAYALRSLISAGDHERSLRPDRITAAENLYRLGFNPYFEPSYRFSFKDRSLLDRFRNGPLPRRLKEAFRESILDFYGAVAADKNLAHPLFFAEKILPENEARRGARFLFPDLREIVLVRDLRDVVCSMMHSAGTSFDSAVADVASMAAILTAAKPDIDADPNAIVVRYEDLITLPDTLDRLFRFLGVYPPGDLDPQLGALFRVHGTSASPADSIRRWRQEFTLDQIERCRVFDPFHEAFGYDFGEPQPIPKRGQKAAQVLVFEGDDAITTRQATTAGDAPTTVIRFGLYGNSEPFLREGWASPEPGFSWTCASASRIEIPKPTELTDYRLRVLAGPFVVKDRLPSQRLVLSINGIELGTAVATDRALIEFPVPNVVLGGGAAAVLTFALPDAAKPSEITEAPDQRMLGFAVERIEFHRQPALDSAVGVEAEARAAADTAAIKPAPAMLSSATAAAMAPELMPDSELMMRFESLGENCEFGLVQRRCGAEPLGLFRFSSAPLPKLLAGLEARFDGLGAPENVEVMLSDNGREYMVFDRRFEFLYHAWVLADEMSPAEIHAREIRRLPFLVRKLLDDFADGSKIFVYHGMEPLAEAEIARLLRALRAYGPNTLLWVEVCDAEHAPGTVEWVGPGLLKAYIDRFAPGENAHDLSLGCWTTICREAYRLREKPAADAAE